tara:strand:+ start:439 stop:831 length:393 start_codon:yes stop_codon:yes gene_type:complete
MAFYKPDSIYKSQSDVKEELLQQEFFTLSGNEEFTLQDTPRRHIVDDQVYAKRIQRKDGTYKLSIRTATDGKLYNPMSIYGEEKKSTLLDNICKSNEKFRTVNSKAFDLYIQFLSSKNLAYLFNAERESE